MITKKVSSRYQLKFDAAVLRKYVNAGGTTYAPSAELSVAIHNFKGDDINISPDTGIIAFTLYGASNNNIRVKDIEDAIHVLIESALTTREDELLAIINWLVPLAQDNPHFGNCGVAITLGRVAQRVINGEPDVSFIGTLRRVK